MADVPSFAGVVPASGASRRMGRAKATLPLEGRTFLERVTASLRDGGCDPVFVVFDPTDAAVAAEVARLGGDTSIERVENPDPGEGPITSLRLALARVPEDREGVAWLPLDYPLVDGRAVARLVEAARASGADLTLPVHEGKRGHPALFRRTLFDELADPALEGGARIVVHRHLEDACLVPFEGSGVVTDVDTPEAYEAVRNEVSS